LGKIAKGFEVRQDYDALKSALDGWYDEVKRANWKNSADIKSSFAHASIVGANRVFFNIRGNNYRLVTYVDYRRSAVYIKWFGTHKQYDEIDVRTVSMNLKPIKTPEDHDAALKEIERLWGAEDNTPEGDRLDILLALVEAYEEVHFPMDPPDPIEAIKFRLEQQGLDQSALIGVIGSRTRVYEVLRGDRPLSLAMIRRLHEKFGIPAEVLIRPTRPRAKQQAA